MTVTGRSSRGFWRRCAALVAFVGPTVFSSPASLAAPIEPASGMADPAAVYCADLGYQYRVVRVSGGEAGQCVLPGGTACDAWRFLVGLCGSEHSWCALRGYETEVRGDGASPFSQEYAVCTTRDGAAVGRVTELASLAARAAAGGGREPVPAAAETAFAAAWEAADPLPAAFDWRSRPEGSYLTGVRAQGGCGSCWAFATLGAVEAALNIANRRTGDVFDLSEQYLVSDCLPGNDCAGGRAGAALGFVKSQGVPDEACMRYADGGADGCGFDALGCNADLCTYATEEACSDRKCGNRCAGWKDRLTMVDGTGTVSSSVAEIKAALVGTGPLVASLYQGGAFTDGIYRCADDQPTNHAVVIVGYDDADSTWTVRNSWGADWNGDGYYKVAFGQCRIESNVRYVKRGGFNSSFVTNRTGWALHRGTWGLKALDYLASPGLSGNNASVSYNSPYSEQTFEARIKRTGCSYCANWIAVWGETRFVDTLRWRSGIALQYTNDGYFSVWKRKADIVTPLQDWTLSPAVVKGGMNRLKVVALGPRLRCYVNGTLVWEGTDDSLLTGRSGVGFYRDPDSGGNELLIDWARLSTRATAAAAGEMALGARPTPGGSVDRSPPPAD